MLATLVLGGCTAGGSPDSPSSPSTSSATPTTSVSPPTPPSASGSPATPPIRISGVQVAERIEGFDRPWEVRFLPDGTPLVTERPGTLAVAVDGQRRLVAAVPGVVAAGEGGLMGLALDPQFEQNRRIYTCFAAGSGGRVQDVRVVRFRLADGLDALGDPTPIVTGIPAGAGNRHLGCRLEIGLDGMLWIGTGDAVQPTLPQDPDSLAGKVLRVTLAGEAAPRNPRGSGDPRVLTTGHRNVQGLAFRASDGAAFGVEHGTGCDDEVNALVPGGNYGWDPVGPGGRYAEDAPMTDPDLPGSISAAWSSGCPTVAPSGAEIITGQQWGDWVGRLAIAVLKDEQLLVATLADDRVTETRAELVGELGRLRSVRNGQDGSLWVTVDSSPGDLVRLVPRTAD
jgi:glucose/arabinose dehydrogenase